VSAIGLRTLALAAVRPAAALYHIAVIDEVATSVGGDTEQQFVEIRQT